MQYHVEAWEIPGVGAGDETDKIIAQVPVVSVQFEKRESSVGQGTIVLPASYPRLNDILDSENDTGSLLRVYQNGTFAYAFFAETMTRPYGAKSEALVTISGTGVENVMSWPVVYPYDYPVFPTEMPDHVYGGDPSSTTFKNGTFDESPDGFGGNGGFEDETLGGWAATSDDGFFDQTSAGPDTSTADKRSGTVSMVFNGENLRSGAQYTGGSRIEVQAGGRYQFQGYGKEPTAAGNSYLMGVKVEDGHTVHSANGFVLNGWAFIEIDNAAKGAGSSDGTWQVFDLDVTMGTDQTETTVVVVYNETPNGPTSYWDDFSMVGPGVSLDGWYKAEYSTNTDPATVPTVTTFQRSTTRVRTGTYSLEFDCSVPSGSSTYKAGVGQKVEGFVLGATYTMTAYISHDDAGSENFAAIAKRPTGEWISSTTTAVPTGTGFTKVEHTFIAEAVEIWVEWRWGATGPDTSPTIWLDDAKVAPGIPAATVGTILQDLLDDAAVDHVAESSPGAPRSVLSFLDYSSFTAALDSEGTSWASDINLTIPVGMRYTQLLSTLRSNFGYEWRVGLNADNVTWELDVFTPLGMGSTKTGMAVLEGSMITSGTVERITPDRTHVIAEGSGGIWEEVGDTTHQTNFERRELYVGDGRANDSALVSTMASTYLDQYDPTVGVSISIQWSDRFLPFVDFDVGDVIQVKLPDHEHEDSYRVKGIQATFSDDTAIFTLNLNAEVIEKQAAVAVALDRHLNKFEGTGKTISGTGTPTAAGSELTGTMADLLIAASDAPVWVKRIAHYVCDGLTDQEEFQLAYDRINAVAYGGTIWFSSGYFSLKGSVDTTVFNFGDDVIFRGLSQDETFIQVEAPGSDQLGTTPALTMGARTELRDLALSVYATGDGSDEGYSDLIQMDGTRGTLRNVSVYGQGHPASSNFNLIEMRGDYCSVLDTYLKGSSAGNQQIVGVSMATGFVGSYVHNLFAEDLGRHAVVVKNSHQSFIIDGVRAKDVGGQISNTYDVIHVENGGAAEADHTQDGLILNVTYDGGATPRYLLNIAGANTKNIRYGHLIDSGLMQTGVVQDLGDTNYAIMYQDHDHSGGSSGAAVSVAHSATTGRTVDDHHARDHASTHSDGGADEIDVINLGAAGAANFIPERDGAGGLQWIATPSGGGSDHGGLTGLGDDDHDQYLKDKAAGGLAAEVPVHDHSAAAEAGTVAHSATTGKTTDDHHAQVHDIDGADHTASGLTTGHVLRASGAAAFAFAQLLHTDLDLTGTDHHAEAHTVVSHSDTTATGTELNTLTDGSNADALHAHTGSGVSLAHGDTTGQTVNDHHAEDHKARHYAAGSSIVPINSSIGLESETASFDIAIPSWGQQVGDVWLIHLAKDDDGSGLTLDAEFTSIYNVVSTVSRDSRHVAGYRVHDGTETGPWSFTQDIESTRWVLSLWRGVDPLDPLDSIADDIDIFNDVTGNPISATDLAAPNSANPVLVSAVGGNDTTTVDIVVPSTMTEVQGAKTTAISVPYLYVAYEQLSGTSAPGTRTWVDAGFAGDGASSAFYLKPLSVNDDTLDVAKLGSASAPGTGYVAQSDGNDGLEWAVAAGETGPRKIWPMSLMGA